MAIRLKNSGVLFGAGQKVKMSGNNTRTLKATKGQLEKMKEVGRKTDDFYNHQSLSKINLEGTRLQKGAGVFKTANSSFLGNMRIKENRKMAGRGIVKSTAASAAAHGGLAYLQGEDPWEAAKTGAIRGALVGGGYQYAKAATGAKSNLKGIKGIKDNLRQIGTGGRDIVRAHSITGNLDMKKDIRNISPQLKRVLQQKERNEMTGGLFGLKTK